MKNQKKCKWFDLCPLKKFYEQGNLDKRWIADYCFDNFLKCTRYTMEQKGVSKVVSVNFDATRRSN